MNAYLELHDFDPMSDLHHVDPLDTSERTYAPTTSIAYDACFSPESSELLRKPTRDFAHYQRDNGLLVCRLQS